LETGSKPSESSEASLPGPGNADSETPAARFLEEDLVEEAVEEAVEGVSNSVSTTVSNTVSNTVTEASDAATDIIPGKEAVAKNAFREPVFGESLLELAKVY
jgi:hypothetical protein